MTSIGIQRSVGPYWQRVLDAVSAPRMRIWVICGLMVTGTALHYGDALPVLHRAAEGSPVSLAYRQSVERILFLVPVMYAAYVYGMRGGLGTLAATAAILVPRALIGSELDHAVAEVGGVLAVGALLTLVIVQQQEDMATQKRMHESMGYFVRQMMTAQEDERNRIALELHDEPAQALLVICQRLDALAERERARTGDELSGELRGVRESVVHTLTGLRRLSQGLRPRILDDHGLAAALGWLGDQIHDESGIEIQVETEGRLADLPLNTQLLLFRIAQEAMRNVARHASASQAVVSVRTDGRALTMTITDDGRGFLVPPTLSDLAGSGRLGLAGMAERVRLLGGVLNIRSVLGKGSMVEVELPCTAAADASLSASVAQSLASDAPALSAM
jgi:two-component system, NarL family, sensor histidine kinase DegS